MLLRRDDPDARRSPSPSPPLLAALSPDTDRRSAADAAAATPLSLPAGPDGADGADDAPLTPFLIPPAAAAAPVPAERTSDSRSNGAGSAPDYESDGNNSPGKHPGGGDAGGVRVGGGGSRRL